MFYFIIVAAASELDHLYEDGERVTVWYNRGILPDSQNSLFDFGDIPWCQGPLVSEYETSVASMFSGVRPLDSGIDVRFKQDLATQVFCQKKLTNEEYKRLIKIVQYRLFAELSIDQLPAWTAIGDESEQIFAYTTFHFTIHYNKNQIIQVKILPDDPVLLYKSKIKTSQNFNIKLSYSVSWIPTDQAFDSRMEVYSQSGMFPTSIHWFSILNSSAIILFVCFLIFAIIYKSLKKDFNKEEGIFDLPTGWKNVESEAVSVPVLNSVLSALTGIGSEIFVVIFCEICLLELDYHERENFIPWIIALSGLCAGFVARYTQQELRGWIFSVFCAGGCFPCIIFISLISYTLIGILINTTYFIGIGLNTVFFLAAVKKSKPPEVQKVKIRGMIIKKKPWYLENWFLVTVGGVLPFISIALELSFLLRTLLTYQLYIMHGFLIISFLQVVVCLACVGIATTYLVLNTEDPNWQWPAFFSGGVLGMYILLYSVYFYTFISGWEGILIYLVNMAGICILIFLASGFVSYFIAKCFVHKLYERLKND